tara:strand:- start:23 stop:616 length:594 start_codon:yes stop_codon:yes gene_type:complete
MKLLREFYELCDGGICQDLLTEEEKIKVENGTKILSGVMQMSERQNANGRVYSHAILEREVKKYKIAVEQRRALGELDHPESGVINLQNCSHLVTDIWMEGNKCMGKIEVLGTPAGKILESLIDAEIPCGISSRGMGSIREENGVTMVEDDFQLICFDMVADPSTPGAYMMKEARDIPFSEKTKIDNLIESILRTKA